LAESDAARIQSLEAEVERRLRELEVLAHVAARVHGVDSEQAVFEIALDEILSRLGLTAAWIFTGSAPGAALQLAASRGVSAAFLDEVRTRGLTPCLCPEVLARGTRAQARNTTQCPRMPHIIEGSAASVAHACIPLTFEASTMGVLNVAARPGEVFTEGELAFLETLGHQVGLAVERARHREAERQRDLEARVMAAVSKAVGAAIEVTHVLDAIGDAARDLLGAERVLVLLGHDATAMTVAHASGLSHPRVAVGAPVDVAQLGLESGAAALEERQIFGRAGAAEERSRSSEPGSGLALPMSVRERVLGLLVVMKPGAARWTPPHVQVAEAFAAQAALRLDNARLYEDARRAYAELRDAQDRVIQQEKMAVLGTFASGLAHEVRNPLNSIGLQLTVLERRIARLAPQLAPESTELAGAIRDEVRRLDRLVGDFLLFARSGRLLEASGDLDAVAEDAVALLAPEADAVGVRLECTRAGAPARGLRLDPEKMKQVVINLVRNAIEAQPEGGVVVVQTGADADGAARLTVHDAGPGLPDSVDVFQVFVTTKAKGTGLGLSIVQQIVRHHGGTVQADRGPLGGARFIVDLPPPAAPQGESA
jgi:signal transduction histidine kinase